MFVRKMRNLRLKHGVTLGELAQEAKLSHQRLSELELSNAVTAGKTSTAVARAFEEVVASRRSALYALERDFYLHKNGLLDRAKEGDPL